MTTDTMVTTPIKEPAAAREKFAQPERTLATELPQELSKLSGQYGFSEVNSFLMTGGKSASHGGGRKKAGRPKKAAAVPQTRQRAVTTASGFTDDGHPTILAATRS